MTVKIDKKIIGYKVLTDADKIAKEEASKPPLEVMHEQMNRPEMLVGSTYKIKPPNAEYALYVTINDVVLNAGTEFESRHPYELFFNSKNMDYFQWVVALTRVTSCVFRSGVSLEYIVSEMKQVFDPRGGYYKKGGVFMPSMVAEIGHTLEKHLIRIGNIKRDKEEVTEHVKAIVAEKLEAFEAVHGTEKDENDGFPRKATLCKKCGSRAVVVLDNCATCLSCQDSHCG